MTEVIERVANAIGAELLRQELAEGGDFDEATSNRLIARAALEALREPTEGMVDGEARIILLNDRMGCNAGGATGPRDPKATVLTNIWSAMISAALSE